MSGQDSPSPSATPQSVVPYMLLGLFAASAYSVANLALRGLSKTDGGPGWDMWVAGTKAFPTFAIAVLLLTIRRIRGQQTFADWDFVWPIAVAAFFNQLGGNFAFQMSLRAIGLAISVPICFASIICSGAIVGRVVLNDRVTIRTAISMSLMVASIVFLSLAAQSRSADPAKAHVALIENTDLDPQPNVSAPPAPPLSVPAGVALSVISGLCYGITGVFIRKAVRSHMPVAATLFLFSAAGFLMLCPMSLLLLPVRTITQTTPAEWLTIATAGIFNAIGFFAITHAMRYLTISRANVINASQNALCAVGAVLMFNEQLSSIGIVGILLTITGLLTLDRK
jgi:DME family drug/metabolite transporter